MSHKHTQQQSASKPKALDVAQYPDVDGDGIVNGLNIPAFAGTPLASFRHMPGDVGAHVPIGSFGSTNVQKNQGWQLQVRLGLNDPDVLLQSAQFVQGADYGNLQGNGNPTQYSDVFVWPSATENRKGLNLSDAQSIVDYFTAQQGKKHGEPWPTIKHEVGPVATGEA